MDNLQDTLLKDYHLEERIGSGGFGAVYRARQTTINREVAVKIILPGYANNPDFIRRFETEAQLIARLEHPHITPLIDYWRDPNGAYLVMRYLRGGSLRQSLQTESYELNTISLLLDQIASALDFAHRASVIHRDIKPGNILLDEDGNAYLADFGIAKDLQTTTENQTAADAVVGSLDYISPEQARSEPVTPRTDIYSLGVTLYEMITSEHPFKEATSIERLYKHINDPLPDIGDLPDDVCDTINDIIQKATAKDPDKRYPDVLALAVAFREGIGRGSPIKEERLIEQLTMREHEILALITNGLTNAQIAEDLFITVSTVKWHISQLYKKLGVRNRVHAIVRGRELNLITTGDATDDLKIQDTLSSVISLPEPQNPYKGLHAFQITDSREFFGRDDLINKLVDRMQAQEIYHRFLAIVGPSGSGKSSLVRAGLIPSLWQGAIPGSKKWFIVDLIPGRQPLDKLETALIRVAANQAENLREQLQRDERGLLRVADIILPADETELVIVIDQFEEVFTLLEDEAERQHFLNLLRIATTELRSRVRIVITLRADYYDRPLHYPEFGELMRERLETVLPLSAKGLERAVRGPAERVGVTFEQGLVEQIVSQMNYQAGALPLLQYALTELFDRREGRLLTHDAYQQIGGAVGALANRADEIYRHLSNEGRELAHQMFMRLVTLGEGAEDTRRRATHAELLSLTDETDLMEEIIEQFAAYRLVSLDHDPQTRQPTVEVAHEAILREWDRLRQWLNESREDIRQERLLARAANDWLESGKDTSFLLRGTRLEQIESWVATTQITTTPLEREFISASLDQQKNEAQREVERVAREEQQEQRSQTLLRALVTAFALVALGAVIFALVVLDQQRQTQQALARANSLVLAAEAIDSHEGGRTETNLPLLLALEAVDMDNPPADAVSALSTLANDHGLRDYVQVGAGKTATVAISLDAQTIVLGGCDNGETFCPEADGLLLVFDIASRQIIGELILDAGQVEAMAWHPDGDRVAFATTNGLIGLVDPTTQEIVARFTDYTGTLHDILFALDGERIFGAGSDGTLVIFDVTDGSVIEQIEAHTGAITDIDLSTDGTRLITASNDNTVTIWDLESDSEIMTYTYVPETDPGLFGAVFTESDTAVLISTVDVRYLLWDLETNSVTKQGTSGTPSEHPYGLDQSSLVIWHDPFALLLLDPTTWTQTHSIGFPSRILNFDINETHGMIAAGTTSGHIGLIDLARDRRIGSRTGLTFNFSPDGSRMVLDQFEVIQMMNLSSGDVLWEAELTYPVADFAFSPDGQQVVSIGGDAFNLTNAMEINMLDAETGEILWTRTDFDYLGRTVTYSNSGAVIAVGTLEYSTVDGDDGELTLLDAQTGETIRNFDTNFAVFDILFTEDDSKMVVGFFEDGVRIIDTETGQTLSHILDGEHAFSLDWIDEDEILIGSNTIAFRANIETGEVIQRYSGFWELVDVSVHPTKPYFLAGDYGGTVALVNYETGERLFEIRNIGQTGWNAQFTPDGTRSFVSDWTGTITEWSFEERPLDELIDWIENNRFLRDFTCQERRLYRIEPFCDES